MIRKSLIALAIGASIGISAPVLAAGGSTSSIYGEIQNASGTTQITATNPKTGFSRTIEVDSDGNFRFPKLETGSYKLEISQNGNVIGTKTVRVSLGSNTSANFNFDEMTAERIQVTGARVSAIDLTSMDSGLVLGEEEIDRLPIGRNLTSVALLAPGAVSGDSGFGDNPSFGGASVAENACYINGLEVTNTRTGLGCGSVPFEFYKEFQVKTGGYSAEFGRATGGVINSVTKSGTNEWEFGFTADWSPNGLQEEGSVSRGSQGIGNIFRDDRLASDNSFDYTISAGGPLIEDKLFIYALVNPRDISKNYTWGGTRFAGVDEYRTRTSDGSDNLFWGGKIDWDITENHRLSYFAYSDRNDSYEDIYAYDGETQTVGGYLDTYIRKRGGDAQSLTYTGYINNDLSISAMWGEIESQYETSPANIACSRVDDERINPAVAAVGCAPGGSYGADEDTNTQYRFDVEWYVGNHTINAGLDKQTRETTNVTIPTGPEGAWWTYTTYKPGANIQGDNGSLWVNDTNQDIDLVDNRYFAGGGNFESDLTAYYIEDKWQITMDLMLSIGLRKDIYEGEGTTGKKLYDFDTDIAPRLGFTWDVLGDGESKLYGTYGRYYLPVANNTIYRSASGIDDYTTYYTFDGIDSATGEPIGIEPVNGTAENSRKINSDGSIAPSVETFQSQEAEPFARDEYIVGYQHAFNDQFSGEVIATYREVVSGLDDYCGIYAQAAGCILLNPGETSTWYDADIADGGTATTYSAETIGLPEAENEYTSLQAKLNYVGDNSRLNFIYTWSRSVGNFEGAVKSDIDQADAGVTQDFDFPALMDGAYGYQPNDRRHVFKLYGSYDLTEDLIVGFNSTLSSGRPLSAFGQGYPVTDDPAIYGSYGDTFYLFDGCSVDTESCAQEDKIYRQVTRGEAGRTPWTFNLDVSATYLFSYEGVDMKASINVTNLLNTQEETSTNEHYEVSEGTVNQYYGAAYSWQAPRAVRLHFEARY